MAAFQEFLLAYPALFSIVNPISGAFIFNTVCAGLSAEEHARLARRVALNSLVVMMIALWAGSYVLAFFGITLAALRCAGGLMVALSAWNRLNAPERQEARKQEQVADRQNREDIALFPLTIPFTTGPGTIAVSVALGAAHPPAGNGQLLAFFIGVSGAAVAMAATVWACYGGAERLWRLLGASGGRTVTRLSAFLLLCIGVQILITRAGRAGSAVAPVRCSPWLRICRDEPAKSITLLPNRSNATGSAVRRGGCVAPIDVFCAIGTRWVYKLQDRNSGMLKKPLLDDGIFL